MRIRIMGVGVAAAAVLSAGTMALSSAPVASASSQAALRCHAWMSNNRPKDYTTTDVNVSTVRSAKVRTIAHYKTTDTTHRATANSRGRATVPYYISGATPGFRVRVSVRVKSGGRTAYCHASFIPHR
jgi:hypothetical protein